MALGASVTAAFNRFCFLEWCCTTQVRALSMGQPLRRPPAEVAEPILKVGQGEGFRD